MATYTPPPYFPQGSLSPPDERRYRKVKLIVGGVAFALVALFAGLVVGAWYLMKWVF
jgi:hypothetical protein